MYILHYIVPRRGPRRTNLLFVSVGQFGGHGVTAVTCDSLVVN